jgi:hypothetical protein
MLILPEELPLHLAKMDTGNDVWLIAVANVTETQSRQNLLLKLTLEQTLDGETFRSRELSLMAPAALLFEAEASAQVIDRIRDWVEESEGDGFLDLVRN